MKHSTPEEWAQRLEEEATSSREGLSDPDGAAEVMEGAAQVVRILSADLDRALMTSVAGRNLLNAMARTAGNQGFHAERQALWDALRTLEELFARRPEGSQR